MGITEELLQKKSKKTTGITQHLLERKKAGFPAMDTPVEVTDYLLGGALVRNNPAMQAQVQKMGQTVYDAVLDQIREIMPSPIEATDDIMDGKMVEENQALKSLVEKQWSEMNDRKNFGYLYQAKETGEERLGQIENEIQTAEQTRRDNPLPVGAASGLKFAQTMQEDPQTAMEQAQKNLQAQEEIRALEREKERINYIRANTGKTFDDNFFGQFGASYALGRMRQDESLAWNKYLEDPTEENRAYAEAIGQLANKFEQENEATLAPDATLPWVSQSLANYLPQLADQVKYSAVGAIGGAAAGSAVPVLGTATGIKAGITAASGLYSYQTMRGAAFKSLLDLGVDEETAKAAANDEAVVSSLIEMADTGIDLLTLGGGKLITALTKGGVKTLAKEGAEKAAESAGKKLIKALGKYGLNVAGEFSEEAAQQAVSIANADRVSKGADDGILGLMADAGYGVLWEAAENRDDPNRAEILKAGYQGAIIAGLMGPLQAGFNQLAYTGVTAMDTKASADYGQQLRQQGLENTVIEAGLKFQEGSQVRRMADAISQKQKAGQQITEVELGDLYRAIKLGQQQAYQTTMQQAQEEARQQESAAAQQAEGILLPTADEVEVQARAEAETNPTRRSGILAGAREEDMESAARLSEALGRDVQFFREEAGPAGTVNGYYDANTGTIYINSRSQNPVAQIIAHELTHSVEMAESYGELRAVVIEQMERDGVDIAKRRIEMRELYARNNKPLLDDIEADQEIVAQFVEQKLLTDEQTIVELTRTNRTLMERILEWINRTLQKLGLQQNTERDTLERAREIYARAMQETRESNIRTEPELSQQNNIQQSITDDTNDGSGPYEWSSRFLERDQDLQSRVQRAKEKINTPEFRKWFQDSQVKNVSGEPLLVFHGAKDYFTKFRGNDKPIWFSPNAWYASKYANDPKRMDKFFNPTNIYIKDHKIIPAYLSASNMAEIGNTDNPFTETLETLAERTKIPENEWAEVWEQVGRPESTWQVINTKETARLLQKYGYDGIIATENKTSAYAVFNPNQVKSAIANKGTFKSTNEDIRYSLSETLEDDLQKVLDGTFPAKANEVYIGETSNFMTDVIGADSLRVIMPPTKAYSAMVTEAQAKADGRYNARTNYHGLGIDGLVKALNASENPVAAFAATSNEKGKRENRIVLVTEETWKDGNIVVVEEIETTGFMKGRKLEANKVITTYDRHAIANDIVQAALEGRLLYLDEKRSQPTLAGMPAANSQGAIRGVDFEKNIQDFWANVKWAQGKRDRYVSGESDSGKTAIEMAFEEARKKAESKTRYSISDDQESIRSEIMLPTAEESMGQVMPQEDAAALVQEESMSSEEMAKALQQESDAYFEGLLEEAEQDDAPKETVTKKDLQEFWDMVEGTEEYRKLTINAEDKVRTDAKKKNKTAGQAIKEAYRAFIRSMVDSGEAVQRAGKIASDERLYEYYNAARAASSAAENMIQNESTDILGRKTGESLAETLKNVRSKGQEYYRKFQLYLYHTHNVDRMSMENLANVQQAQEAFAEVRNSMPELGQFADYQIEQMAKDPGSRYYAEARDYIAARDAMRRAEGQRNKPVFGPEVTADVSRQEAAELLREYPEFEEEAQKVYDYLDNLMKYRIDSGLVTEQEAQMLKQIYPHYVPVYREFERSNTDTREKNRVQIGKTIKRAKGGEEIIMPLHKSMALQTRSVVREGTKNRFGSRLLEDQLSRSERGRELVKNVQETVAEVNANTFDQLEDTAPKRNNVFTVLQDGKRYDMEVDPSLFTAVEALGNNGEAGNNILTATVRKFNNLFKAMVTGYNPAFMARNFIRDLQDAALYSKDAKAWAANYPAAIKEIAANGEYWRQYKALGGVHSSVFDYETGMTRESKNPASKILNRVEALNMAVEQAPRLAEFIATVKKAENAEAGVTMDTLMEALYNANDITTNFGRSGTIGKWLNANLVPFLNPSIQGFDKMLRQLGETKGFKSWANLAAKAALLGIAPAVINQFVYGDEDDWDKIKQRDRDVYYLFKIGDGKWLKIPKGRALSLVGMAANRTIEAARGEQIDILDTLNTAISQTAPSNPLENNILQAWMDADLLDKDSPGKTWYGSDIESQRLQNYAPGERYDQSTDKLSKFLGQATGLSPAKINYLLDQYTGVVGDILLPMITPSDTSIPGLAPVVSAFTLDTAYSNRTSGDFYETLDQLTYAKNKEDANGYETVVYRFFNKQADAVGEINAAIREIEADEALSDAEKRELVRAQYQIRNSVEEQALDKVAAYQAAAEKYYEASDKEDEEDKIEEAYREANREIMGAEYALKTYSKEVYERAAALQEDGVSYDTFFDLYFDNRDTELTGYEKTNRTRDLLRELDVDEEQKKALYKDFVSDSETNQERIKSLEDAGAAFDDFLTIQNKYNEINETVDKAKQKSVAFAYWLDTEGFTEEQSAAAQGAFKFYSQIPGQDTTYEKFKNSGLSAEEAYRLAAGLDTLEPDKGNETVSKEQKWREVLDSDLSSEKKLAALKSVSTETQAEKFEIADAYGVDLEEYVSIMERLPEFDADGNGRYTQSEVTNAINSIMSGGTGGLVLPNLSDGLVLPVAGGGENRDKAVLWQLITGSKSAKNNPYSVEIGEEVLQNIGKNSGGLVLPDLGGSSGGLVLPDLGDSSGGLVLPDLG